MGPAEGKGKMVERERRKDGKMAKLAPVAPSLSTSKESPALQRGRQSLCARAKPVASPISATNLTPNVAPAD